MLGRETKRRFWEKIAVPADENSCWEWTAYRAAKGYGRFKLDGRMQGAHRVAWRLVNGDIPEGEGAHGTCVLHRCDNPSCVRPDHLFLGTNADNVRDRNEKGRQARQRGQAHGRAKLTREKVYAIRADTRLQREIAADHGIDRRTVSDIKRHKRWAHLPDLVAHVK